MVEDVDLGLKRPSTFLLKIREKLLVVMGEVDIGTIPATITPINQVTMVDFCVYLALLTMLMVVFVKMKGVIVGVVVQDVEVGLDISASINFTMIEKVLMLII